MHRAIYPRNKHISKARKYSNFRGGFEPDTSTVVMDVKETANDNGWESVSN